MRSQVGDLGGAELTSSIVVLSPSGIQSTSTGLYMGAPHPRRRKPRGGLWSLDVRRERRHSPSAALRRWAVSATPSTVAAIDLERAFEVVRSKAAGPTEGVFGAGSTIWQVDREALVFLGAGRALLLQLAQPWVSTAIAERSTALSGSNQSREFHRTFEIIFSLVFGSLEHALATSRRLHRRHAGISGHLPETLGPYVEGSPYLANDVPALMRRGAGRWVRPHSLSTIWCWSRWDKEPRARYYSDCQLLGVLFGIPLEAQPPDWPAFARYFEAMVLTSEELTVGAAAREIGKRVLAGAGRVPIPRWYRNVTVTFCRSASVRPSGWRLGKRSGGAPYVPCVSSGGSTPFCQPRFATSRHTIEALGRLCGRSRPNLMTRSLNRLWIGRRSMEPSHRKGLRPSR